MERSISTSRPATSFAATDLTLPRCRPPASSTWRTVLAWLREDKILTRRGRRAHRAPLRRRQQRASIRWCASAAPASTRVGDGKVLDTEALTEWLARRCKLPYLRIDPLKVDVGRVADVMSINYAERRHALPLQLRRHRGDDRDLRAARHRLGRRRSRRTRARRVRLVIVNPLEIARYTTEFYALSRSVRNAHQDGRDARRSPTSSSWSSSARANKQLDANDSGVVQVVDWLWQYAFDQRASDIHLEPRRERSVIRFRIDGVMHTVYQLPPGVMSAMIARVKLLGRMDVVEKRRPLDGRIKVRNPRRRRGRDAPVDPARPRSARRW